MMYRFYALLASLYGHIHSEDESGQGLAEYGLILALIAVVAVAALTGLGTAIASKLNAVASAL
jgi:pilus assembly protein Flp/PilA